MLNEIGQLIITDKYRIRYRVGKEWKTKSLTPEVFNDLMDSFTEEDFILDIDSTPPEYYYDEQSMQMPPWSLFSAIKFEPVKNTKSYNDRGGNFFKYVTHNLPSIVVEYLKRLQIFDKLNDDDNKQRKELNDCCFVYALKQTGEYSEMTLNQIRMRINTRYLSNSSVEDLCNEFKIHLKLNYIDDNNKLEKIKHKNKKYFGVSEDESEHKHIFNIYNKHYFIEERTPFTNYYINHVNTLPTNFYNKRMNGKKLRIETNNKLLMSSKLVRILMKTNHFKPITFGQFGLMTTIYSNEIPKELDFPLEYNKEFCTRLIEPKKYDNKNNPSHIWFCDFETDVSGEYHKPFMCVLQSEDGTINEEFRGFDCSEQLLEYLPNGSLVYFHNLAYDIRMFAHYGLNRSIIKGTKFLSGCINYKEKSIRFKDTLPILSCKLSSLPQMFNLPNIQKEIFPYKYYTFERLKHNKGVINDAGQYEEKQWTDDDYKLFNDNIDKIPGCRINDNYFNMWRYASFYCQQDVTILRLGFNEFRKGFISDFNIDPLNFISISSLANEVFNERVYYTNHNLFKVGGVIRKFCSYAVHGGRCMCAYNKKWHVKKQLCDFDAVSLYPSAMSRLYTVEGIPSVIQPDQLNLEFLSKQSAYVVKIIITNVRKHYPFPLIMKKINGININDDNIKTNESVTMYVDNIELEDLINFQQIDFKFVKGYYWSGKRDYSIQSEIRKIFNKRLEYKKQNNPLQQLYKLIMNSCYGKTIEKPVDNEYKYFYEGEKLNKFWCKNYEKIIEDIEFTLSNKNNQKLHTVKIRKPIDKHFNFSLLGIQVLSMSKRIMNEVMCLAYDIGCHIYYQDTDSFMIEKDDLTQLEIEFNKKYNRELIGENLGQFHCDFPSINNHKEMPWSIEAYFLMKKMYIHKITDSSNDIDYVIRGKGLTLNSIKHKYKTDFDNDPMKLYKSIYDGNTITFDLTQGQTMMKMNKNFTVSTLNHFQRATKTLYEKGKRQKYFEYADCANF